MKTIILCGGLGTRLKEETEYKPKPMVMIGNKPIIWHIMKIYSHYGYNNFILALGYKADYIKDFFLNQKAFTSDFTLNTKNHEKVYHLENRLDVDNFKITFVDTGIDTLPGERILGCRKYIPLEDKNFMVTYGDAVSEINITDLVKFHLKQKKVGTMTGVHPWSRVGIMQADNNNKVKKYIQKTKLRDWANGGFMVFDNSFFDYLKPGETEHPALERLTSKRQLSLYKYEGFWFCMDTYREAEELNRLWNLPKPLWKVW